MSALLIKAILAYLLGGLVGSLLLRRVTGMDIRTAGSGNAGATNAMRTLGLKVAVLVLLIDIAKGWIATRYLAPWAIPGLADSPQWQDWSVTVCGLAVMLGHIYPVWYGFRGGKGFATLVGAVLGISALQLFHLIIVWLVVVILTGYVGLASIVSATGFAVAVAASQITPHTPLVTFAVLATLLIAFTHRSNVQRMMAGTESRARKIWLFGLKRKGP